MADDDLAPAPAVDATSVVAARIDRLVEEIGRPEPVFRAITAFLDRLDDMLLRSTQPGDRTERERAAHTLAGSAETLGAVALGAAARAVMDAAVDESDEAPPASLRERLLVEAGAARQVLRDEVERRGWAAAEQAGV